MAASELSYRPVELYGGAMVANLPSSFSDVSDIRQIPDHQEVYLDANGFTSVVFEILERVPMADDSDALKYHLNDIVDEDVDKMHIWTSSLAHFCKLAPGTPASTIFATSPPGEKQRGRANEPDLVGILLTMVRLVEQKTDFLIAVNVPHVPGSYEPTEVDPATGRHGKLLETAVAIRENIIHSFEIRDWGLFVQKQFWRYRMREEKRNIEGN